MERPGSGTTRGPAPLGNAGCVPRGPLPVRRTLGYRWVCLGLLFPGILLAFLVRLAPAVALPDLREAFALDLAQAGLLTSLFMWPFALMQPVAGVLTDTLGARRSVSFFLAIAGAGQLLLALAPSESVALIGRALSGLGFGTLFVGAALIMTHWFQPRAFATLTGVWTSVGNVGSLVAAAPLALLVGSFGWRSSFAAVGVAVAVLAVMVYVFVRDRPADVGLPPIEPDGGDDGAPTPPRPTWWQGTLGVLRTRETWLLCGYGFMLFGTMTMMQGFLAVPYLMDVYAAQQQQAANYLSLWAVGLIVGCSLWGYVADRCRRRKPVVLWGAVTYSVLWAVLAAWPQDLPESTLWLAMFWGGFFVATWIPSYALLREHVSGAVVGTAMGILNLSLWLGGAAYQQLAGTMLARFADGAGAVPLIGYRVVLWVALASTLLSIMLIALCRER